MWIAYLLPQENFALLEDGLQWITQGETKKEAEERLRYLFEATMRVERYSDEEIETVWNQHHSYARIV
jgi:hypothetical protein